MKIAIAPHILMLKVRQRMIHGNNEKVYLLDTSHEIRQGVIR